MSECTIGGVDMAGVSSCSYVETEYYAVVSYCSSGEE